VKEDVLSLARRYEINSMFSFQISSSLFAKLPKSYTRGLRDLECDEGQSLGDKVKLQLCCSVNNKGPRPILKAAICLKKAMPVIVLFCKQSDTCTIKSDIPPSFNCVVFSSDIKSDIKGAAADTGNCGEKNGARRIAKSLVSEIGEGH
jgi:hypothetical protein